jgi:HK97 gp10 family phage protein
MANEIKIEGLAELNKMLQLLPAKIERNILRGGLRAGAAVFRDKAKVNVPAQMQSLRRSIRITTNARSGRVMATVVAGSRDAYYAHWVEYGTASYYTGKGRSVGQPYAIRPRGGAAALRFNNIYTGSVIHPGVRPKPYMRPAVDAGTDEALRAMVDYMKSRIEREMRLPSR